MNTNNFKNPPALHINNKSVPIFSDRREMVYNGFCKDHWRFKWRCQRVVRNFVDFDACAGCLPSSYGRVIYTKPDWDLRLFTRIPRGSVEWKDKMKQRTAAERVNNRILNHYGIENTKQRGNKRISFFITVAAINIHLDAQLKFLTERKRFDLSALIGFGLTA